MLLFVDCDIQDTQKWHAEQISFFKNEIVPSIGINRLSDTTLQLIFKFMDDICNIDLPETTTELSLENLSELKPIEFEVRCSNILNKQGWKTRST